MKTGKEFPSDAGDYFAHASISYAGGGHTAWVNGRSQNIELIKYQKGTLCILDEPVCKDSLIISFSLQVGFKDPYKPFQNNFEFIVFERDGDTLKMVSWEPFTQYTSHFLGGQFLLRTPLRVKAGHYIGLRSPDGLTQHGRNIPLVGVEGQRHECRYFVAEDRDRSFDIHASETRWHNWLGWHVYLATDDEAQDLQSALDAQRKNDAANTNVALARQKKSYDLQIGKLEAENTKMAERIITLKNDLTSANSRLSALKTSTDQKIESLNSENSRLNDKIKVLHDDVSNCEKKLEILNAKNTKLSNTNADQAKVIIRQQSELLAAQQRLEDYKRDAAKDLKDAVKKQKDDDAETARKLKEKSDAALAKMTTQWSEIRDEDLQILLPKLSFPTSKDFSGYDDRDFSNPFKSRTSATLTARTIRSPTIDLGNMARGFSVSLYVKALKAGENPRPLSLRFGDQVIYLDVTNDSRITIQLRSGSRVWKKDSIQRFAPKTKWSPIVLCLQPRGPGHGGEWLPTLYGRVGKTVKEFHYASSLGSGEITISHPIKIGGASIPLTIDIQGPANGDFAVKNVRVYNRLLNKYDMDRELGA